MIDKDKLYQWIKVDGEELNLKLTGEYDVEVTENEDGTQNLAITDAPSSIADGYEVLEKSNDGFATKVKFYCSSNKARAYACAGGSTSPWRGVKEWILPDNLTDFRNNYVFYMTSWEHIYLPNAVYLGTLTFYAANFKTVRCPKVIDINAYQVFAGSYDTYESIELGSVEHGIIASQNYSFTNMNATIPITLYTNGDYANVLLSNVRNGCINATIIIKASEDTVYNGVSYAAGETMVTSTPEEVQ